jgi:tight adherence protein C
MAAAISIVLFGLLMAAITFIGYRYYLRPGRFYDQLGTAGLVAGVEGMLPLQEGFAVRIIREIGEKVPVSPQDTTETRRYLLAAGYRGESALPLFYGIKVLSCIGSCILGVFFRGLVPQVFPLPIVAMIGCVAAGYFVPTFVLEWIVDKRQEKIRLALPDALDLMVVCVEAGLGLDQAIVNVSRELGITHPDISDEFRLVTLEMQAGKRRADSLRNLADRTGEAELKKLVAVLIQTDRFGTSMADSLRTHSDFMRMRRRQQAEERAAKIGIKLVFAIFFFILPTMFIMTAGPGVLQIFKQLVPTLRQLRGG